MWRDQTLSDFDRNASRFSIFIEAFTLPPWTPSRYQLTAAWTMLVRSKALHYAARSCTLITLSKRTATKTTKKFSELPSVFLRSDGTAASPLGEWHTGPERTPSYT